MVTIKEIAAILCVSPTTVSNVVNGHTEKMSAATRKRIEDALIQYEFNKVQHEEDHSKAFIFGIRKMFLWILSVRS